MTATTPSQDDIDAQRVSGTRAILIVPEIPAARRRAGPLGRSAQARMEELNGLALAIDLKVADARLVKVRQARAATLFGSGQIEELATAIIVANAQVAVIDGSLTAIQQRNLETALKAKVIDRTALILEIFGARAATAEGRLQVELAHLDYQAGRLVRSWTHLERQRGGFGFLGGPGETQIEADRRLIRNRMAKIRRQLDDVRRTRSLQRTTRQRAPFPVIALVGYTNAGKSTLFNRLADADVVARDQLFATLDPTMRAIELPGIPKVILSDTVGFVSDLPTELIAAFRATLEEVTSADLILHVRDIAHPDTEEQARDVAAVLGNLGMASEPTVDGRTPKLIEVWNKLDLLPEATAKTLIAEAASRSDVIAISALAGIGLDTLRTVIAARLRHDHIQRQVTVSELDGAARAWLFAHSTVLGEEAIEDPGDAQYGKRRLRIEIDPIMWGRFLGAHPAVV